MTTRGKQPKSTDLAYIAGIIDGEGTVGMYQKNHSNPNFRPAFRERLAISSSTLELLYYIGGFFPGCITKNTRYSDKHSPMYRLEYHCLKLVPILTAVLPYMIIKKRQAELVLQYRRVIIIRANGRFKGHSIPEEEFLKRQTFYLELRRLNKTGVQPQRLNEVASLKSDMTERMMRQSGLIRKYESYTETM